MARRVVRGCSLQPARRANNQTQSAMKLITLPLFALALALVAAAAQTPPPPLSNPLPPPPLTSTLPPSITPTPTPLPRPLPPPPIKNTGSAAYEPTQLAFDDTDLVDLIKILARQADLNVLFDPKVSGGIAIASTNNPDGRARPPCIVCPPSA